MKLTLDQTEMLALWKRRHFIEPLRADCTIERTDGIDIDARCREEMRAWYLDLLRHGPVEVLAPAEIAGECRAVVSPEGVTELILPAGVERVLSVQLSGWCRAATVITDPCHPPVRLQENPFSRGGVEAPVAIWTPGSEVVRLMSAAVAAETPVASVRAAVDAGPDLYTFDEQAVALINPQPLI